MLLIVLLALGLLCVPLAVCTPRGADAAFALNRAEFERAAADALAAGSGEGVKRPAGVLEIAVWPDPSGEGDCVEFWMGGAGLGPSTSYWGVTFSEHGPVGFQGAALDFEHSEEEWCWSWEEPDGDNWSRIYPRNGGWYLYEMHF